jgi:hypothetical protein
VLRVTGLCARICIIRPYDPLPEASVVYWPQGPGGQLVHLEDSHIWPIVHNHCGGWQTMWRVLGILERSGLLRRLLGRCETRAQCSGQGAAGVPGNHG